MKNLFQEQLEERRRRLEEELAEETARLDALGKWVDRRWRERLFSRPWRPWVRQRWSRPGSEKELRLTLQISFMIPIIQNIRLASPITALFPDPPEPVAGEALTFRVKP